MSLSSSSSIVSDDTSWNFIEIAQQLFINGDVQEACDALKKGNIWETPQKAPAAYLKFQILTSEAFGCEHKVTPRMIYDALHEAAFLGSSLAMLEISEAYRIDNLKYGFAESYPYAYAWLSVAVDSGETEAIHKKHRLKGQLTDDEVFEAQKLISDILNMTMG